jgi:DNA polymerase elongation subunit (family B)
MYRNVAYLPNQQVMRLYTWDETGNRISYDTTYEPYIYLETNNNADATSIFNTSLRKRSFRSQFDRYKYINENLGSRIFENLPPAQQFLVDRFYNQNESIDFSKHPLKIYYFDIETYSPDAFPVPEKAEDPINLITVYNSLDGKFYTWGTSSIKKSIDNCNYVYCKSEREMYIKFLDFLTADYPDIMTGWNSEFFDIPYIINRFNKILGEEETKRLSPIGRITSRMVRNKFGKEQMRWYVEGLACIDYMEIYRKFCFTPRESYKLNDIAEIEIGEGKIDFGDQNLASLAVENWDLFVEYNIQDVNILFKLEKTLRYVELLRMIAYAGCTTFENALGTLSVVNGLCALYARTKDLKIPTFNRENTSSKKNEGAYVAEPQRGFQEHIVSFDANSLYPNVMITLNLSPETKVGKIQEMTGDHYVVKHVNGQEFTLTKKNFEAFLNKESIAVSKANILFSQRQKGMVPSIVDGFYQRRVEIKTKLKKYKKKLSTLDKSDENYKAIQKEVDYLNIKQHTIKILINSIYGYFGNKHSPLGDDDIARSITLTGQSVIKYSNELLLEFIKKNSDITEEEILERCPIIYNDTDSSYVSIKKVVENKNIKMLDKKNQVTQDYLDLVASVENYLNDGIKIWGAKELKSVDCRLNFKREVIADAGMFLMKKRYVLHVKDEEGIQCDKFKYTGVEVVKSTMPSPIKPYAKRIIETMIMTRDKAKTDALFNEAYTTFKSLPVEDFAFVMGIKDYDKYAVKCTEFNVAKGMPIHVKSAYFHNTFLKRLKLTSKYESIASGDKVRFFYVQQPNRYGLPVMAYKFSFPEELKKEFLPDYEKMFEKILYQSMERFYTSVNWKIKPPSQLAQTDLFDLFS